MRLWVGHPLHPHKTPSVSACNCNPTAKTTSSGDRQIPGAWGSAGLARLTSFGFAERHCLREETKLDSKNWRCFALSSEFYKNMFMNAWAPTHICVHTHMNTYAQMQKVTEITAPLTRIWKAPTGFSNETCIQKGDSTIIRVPDNSHNLAEI